jgi:hypothetical protein
MTNRGFEEAPTGYVSDDANSFVGQFRRFGEAGPAYEVINVANESHVAIRVVYSGEELDYRIDRLRADPIAITIP